MLPGKRREQLERWAQQDRRSAERWLRPLLLLSLLLLSAGLLLALLSALP